MAAVVEDLHAGGELSVPVVQVREGFRLAGRQLIVRAIVATGLGSVVGLERSFRYKDAGLRTLALVALGSCAFAIAGFSVLSLPGLGQIRPDPTRIAAQVVSGVGFLGAGAIFVSGGQRIRGLTTAADIWAAASGVLCGVGLLLTAAAVTALGLGS
jgi:putative Mg2+ transporter-C (MgtC) family protein